MKRRKKRQTPIQYLEEVMNDLLATAERRDRAAQTLLPYLHGHAPRGMGGGSAERGRGGKKAEAQQAAEDAASGKYRVPPPPLRLVGGSDR